MEKGTIRMSYKPPPPKKKIGPHMTRAELLAAANLAKQMPLPARESPAVRACVDAFWNQIADALSRNKFREQTMREAAQAYKLSMPEMDTQRGIREYIDAVANGVCLGVFDGKAASTLLYAAQVAMSNLKKAPRKTPARAEARI
jgi:hypothetical protein